MPSAKQKTSSKYHSLVDAARLKGGNFESYNYENDDVERELATLFRHVPRFTLQSTIEEIVNNEYLFSKYENINHDCSDLVIPHNQFGLEFVIDGYGFKRVICFVSFIEKVMNNHPYFELSDRNDSWIGGLSSITHDFNNNSKTTEVTIPPEHLGDRDIDIAIQECMYGISFVSKMFILLLNNKEYVEQEIKPPEKLAIKRVKKGKCPPLSYRSVNISIPESVL